MTLKSLLGIVLSASLGAAFVVPIASPASAKESAVVQPKVAAPPMPPRVPPPPKTPPPPRPRP